MNERIKELAVQAEEYSYKEYAKRETGYTREDFFTKKFAELIVKECENVSLKNSHRNDDMGAIIARHIKQHFGVEE